VHPDGLTDSVWRAVACPPGLTDAWRQIHYAAQVASEVAKSWSHPRDDDSHTNLGWFDEGAACGFEGVATETDPPFHARLDPRRLTLSLVTQRGETHDRFDFHGRTLADAMAWVDAAATKLGGRRRQEAVPAPDLPEHSVAGQAAFSTADTLAFDAVADWYANADALLRKLVSSVPDLDPPRCWPHHLDHATLMIVRRNAQGQLAATIGLGVTPPDALDERGYWYVGPWAADPVAADAPWPEVPAGRWVAREGTMPMAVLPLTEVAALDSATAQITAVAGFVAAAVNACRDRLV
jgi:hypothetical protein